MDKPKIRFKEFTDNWIQHEVGEITRELTEYATVNSNLPLLTSSRSGILYQSEYRDGVTTKNEETLFSVVPTNVCTYRHMSDDDTFHLNINHLEKGLVSREYPVFEGKESNLGFVVRSINSSIDFLKFCKEQKKGGTRTRLYYKNLCEFKLHLPSIEEQNQIEGYFSELDNLIKLHQCKFNKLQMLKESMLQKMFPKSGSMVPDIRFKGFTNDWEQRKLEDFFSERSERANGNEELLSVTIANGVIRQVDSNKKNTASADKSNYKLVKKGDLPYNSMRMWQGAVGTSSYEGIVSPAYTVLTPKENANGKFFMELFKKKSTLEIFRRWSQGLTSDTWNLKFPVLSKIVFAVPAIEEQTKIANYFISLDYLITLQQRKLIKLNNFKKTLLASMFV